MPASRAARSDLPRSAVSRRRRCCNGARSPISGDAELAQKFRELAALLTPDVEEELSLLIGDVAAHRLGTLARGGRRWARRAAHTTLANLAEYLAHERRDLVPRNEGEQFLRGVDALREGVDRLQARLELLARRRAQP